MGGSNLLNHIKSGSVEELEVPLVQTHTNILVASETVDDLEGTGEFFDQLKSVSSEDI